MARETTDWVKEIAGERLEKQPYDDNNPYEHLIKESAFYSRKAGVYQSMSRAIHADMRELKAEGRYPDNIRNKLEKLVTLIWDVADYYEEVANGIWNSFEKEAIDRNEHDEGFYELIGEIFKGMANDYRGCVNTISSRTRDSKKRDEAIREFIFLQEFFEDTTAGSILASEVKDPDLIQRYVDSYKWRHKK